MRQVRLAVVGCGQIVRTVHLPVLRRLGVEVVALADPDEVSRQLAARWVPAAKQVRDAKAAVATDCDAVLVATPTVYHADCARQVLAAGKHLYLEKPMAADGKEANAVWDAWRGAGVVAMMGFNYRFNPLVRNMRRLVESGRLGTVRRVRTWFTTPRRELARWRRSRASGGGALLELGSHHFDWVPWVLGGEIKVVSAEVEARQAEADTARVQWTFGDGGVGESFFSLAGERDADGIEVICAHGVLRFDRYANRSAWLTAPRWLGWLPGGYWWRRMRSVGHEPSYQRAWREFLGAVCERRPVYPNLEDGYRSLRLVLAAEESAARGRPVSWR